MRTIIAVSIGGVVFFLVAALLYGVFTFFTMNPDPTHWGKGGRFFFLILQLIGGGAIAGVVSEEAYKQLK